MGGPGERQRHLRGADWTRAGGWCNGSDTRTIVVGDFNGDGRDELLCHDADLGSQHIDFADALGQFAGSNWSANSTWCTSNGSRLFVGDANGDVTDQQRRVVHTSSLILRASSLLNPSTS